MLKLWRKVDEYLHSNKNTETIMASWESRTKWHACYANYEKEKLCHIYHYRQCMYIPSEFLSDINMLVLSWKNISAVPFVLLLNGSKVIAIKSKCIVIKLFWWCTSSAKIREWLLANDIEIFFWQRVLLTIYLSKLDVKLQSREHIYSYSKKKYLVFVTTNN